MIEEKSLKTNILLLYIQLFIKKILNFIKHYSESLVKGSKMATLFLDVVNINF